MKNKAAACTIVSNNYISYAITLGDSFKEKNPHLDFYILVVDKYDSDFKKYVGKHNIIELPILKITNIQSKMFQFDILEWNTNVKPSFLKYLLQEKGYGKVIYFDPDIYIYENVQKIYDLLDDYSCVVTPHCSSPYPQDGLKPDEQDLLKNGVFNLGFIGVSDSSESLNFLTWWERKCLDLGFNEASNGLFVDQKWVNFIQCFADNIYILKDCGYNMAYWNLHERKLVKVNDKYYVNQKEKLVFFHFSGIEANAPQVLSKHQNRYNFTSRNDLIELFNVYRGKLIANGILETKEIPYFYSKFSNGKSIPSLARRLYAANRNDFPNDNPFDVNSKFYAWLQKNNIKSEADSSGKYNSNTYDRNDFWT